MTDVVEFRTGWGSLADWLAGTYLRRLTAMRNATIRTKAESGRE